jgi:hypothetical protein
METPIVITKVTRYCLFKKSERDGDYYLTRIWGENQHGIPTGHVWMMTHLTKGSVVLPIGPEVNPDLAEKLENEYQVWVAKSY